MGLDKLRPAHIIELNAYLQEMSAGEEPLQLTMRSSTSLAPNHIHRCLLTSSQLLLKYVSLSLERHGVTMVKSLKACCKYFATKENS